MADRPYEFEDVIAILIDGMADFIYIKKGSLEPGEVNVSIIENSNMMKPTLTAIDQYDESKLFLFANRLVAVKYEPETLQVVDGGKQTKIARPLP